MRVEHLVYEAEPKAGTKTSLLISIFPETGEEREFVRGLPPDARVSIDSTVYDEDTEHERVEVHIDLP